MNTHKKYRIVPLLVLGVGLTVLAFQHLSSNVAAQVLRHNEPETGRVLPGCNIHNSKRRLPLHSLPIDKFRCSHRKIMCGAVGRIGCKRG